MMNPALPIPNLQSAEPAPRGVRWIDASTAAKRSGFDERTIRRRCGEEWQALGKARLDQQSGCKAKWLVREDAHEKFGRVRFPDGIDVDLSGLPGQHRREVMQRRDILNELETARANGVRNSQDQLIVDEQFADRMSEERGLKLSSRTLRRWMSDFRSSGLAGLIDRRWLRGQDDGQDKRDPFLNEVMRLYLSTKKRKLSFCRELAIAKAEDEGWQVRTYKACRRMISAIPAPVVYKMRGGEEAFVNHAEPYHERDYTTLASNECWCSDHHQFDVVVSVGSRLDNRSGELVKVHKRPWLTAFQDLRSRKIVAWAVYAHDPNSDIIFSVFRQGVLDHGVPSGLLIDNGKDFDCYALNGRTKKERWAKRKVRVEMDEQAAGLFAELNIKVGHALPYHGQSKPIERWFGFLETRTTIFPTYCGNSPANKPEDLQSQIDRGNAPTIEDLVAWFGQWVAGYNASHAHSGQGMDGKAPDQIYAECWGITSKRTAPRELLNLICLKPIKAKIGQNGVMWRGLRYGQYEPSLQRLLGEEVLLRVDERDISHLLVHSADDSELICRAPCNDRIPANANAQELRRAMAKKARSREILKEYRQNGMRIAEDLPELMMRDAAEKSRVAAAERDPSSLPNISPIHHHLEDQLPALQRAMARTQPLRVARPKALDIYCSEAIAGLDAERLENRRFQQLVAAKLEREHQERMDREATEEAQAVTDGPFGSFIYHPTEASNERIA